MTIPCIAPLTSHCTKGNCDEVPLTKTLKFRVKIIIISIHSLLLYVYFTLYRRKCRGAKIVVLCVLWQVSRGSGAFDTFAQTMPNKLAKAKDAHALCNNLGEFLPRNLKQRPRKESCRTEKQVYDVLFTGGVDPSKTNT